MVPGRHFISRAKALWNEYVLNLHRLGWDLPENLPEPPVTSEFHRQWQKKRDPKLPDDNIYRQKFEAYYGRDVTCAAMNGQLDATPERTFAPRPEIKRLPLPESQLRLLVAVLGAEPGLVPIWNWQRNGVAARTRICSA